VCVCLSHSGLPTDLPMTPIYLPSSPANLPLYIWTSIFLLSETFFNLQVRRSNNGKKQQVNQKFRKWILTFLSAKSVTISPAISTATAPPPMIRIDCAATTLLLAACMQLNPVSLSSMHHTVQSPISGMFISNIFIWNIQGLSCAIYFFISEQYVHQVISPPKFQELLC